MYKLTAKEPFWFDLIDGVQLYVKPITSALMLKVQGSMPQRDDDADEREWFVEFIKHVALAAIMKWSGIGDANGEPAEITKENVWCLLDDYQIFTEFQSKYLGDYEQRQQEKNA